MGKPNVAIKPDYFSDIKSMEKKEVSEETLQTEEKLLHDLALSNGWPVLKTYVEELIEGVDALSKHSMESGASYEEIGKRSLVAELVKKYLQLAITKVTDAYESVEQQPRDTK